MKSRLSLSCVVLVVGVGVPWARTFGEEKGDTRLAVLAGEWKIVYTQGAVRFYTIEGDGKVSFPEEKRTGRIEPKGGMLLLTFKGDNKLERLTLGTDGRLFVEHYDPKDDFPAKRATHVGIGIRQK